MLSHEGSYDQPEGSESGFQNSARGFDRPNQNVFDLSMDYSDDEVLLDWEQYAGAAFSGLSLSDFERLDVLELQGLVRWARSSRASSFLHSCVRSSSWTKHRLKCS